MKMMIATLCGLLTLLPALATETVILPQPKSNHVVVKFMFRVGSIDDPSGKQGLTNLTAQLMADGGTEKYSKQEIDDIIYPMAVNYHVSVGKEATTFTTTIHKDHLAKAYGIFENLVVAPRMDPSDFERIKKAVLKVITQDLPNISDEVLSKRVLDTLLFDGHPYQYLIEGTETAVEGLTLEDVKAHHKKMFTQANLIIGLAGGFDDGFLMKVQKGMTRLPKGEKQTRNLPEVRMPKGIEGVVVSKPQAQGTAIFMGYPLDLDRSDDEFAALMVANSYLGEHRKSYGRLYKAMRGSRSLNYGDYSYIEWYPIGHFNQLPLSGYPRSQNFFSIWIRPVQIAQEFKGIEGLEEPSLGNGVHSIRQPLRELGMLVKSGINEEDFKRTRQFLMGYLKLYVQSPERRLGFMMDSRFYNRKDYINEMIALLEKLKLEDVNKAIKKYFQPDNMFLAVITDDSEAQKLADALKNNSSAPIVYKPVVKAGLDKELLEEDKAIDNYKLNVTKMEVIDVSTLFKK